MVNVQALFNNYLNIKFNRGLPAVPMEDFEYAALEDHSAELFFRAHEHETFLAWAEGLQPPDPQYSNKPHWKPMLASFFHQLDVYDEQVFHYLLYTINSTTRIIPRHPYNTMNDLMKNYCFFQLAQLSYMTTLNEEQKQQLKDFLFFFYLYAHPVNEETLYAFSFQDHTIVHTKTNIRLEQYLSLYHDHFFEHYQNYKDLLALVPDEINACKHLTLELLKTLEGKSHKLAMPHEEGLEDIIRLINDVDHFLHMYSENKLAFFQLLNNMLLDEQSNPYRDHCISMLLQHYAIYILYFHFDELQALVEYFQDSPLLCKIILNKMFADTIFLQKIMRQSNIDINNYPKITQFFDEEAKRIYLD